MVKQVKHIEIYTLDIDELSQILRYFKDEKITKPKIKAYFNINKSKIQ